MSALARATRFGVVALALAAVASFGFVVLLHPPARDLFDIALVIAAPVTLATLAATLLPRWIARTRRLARVPVAVVITTAAMIATGVALASQRMFLSTHDAKLLAIVLALSAGLAVLVGVTVTRPLAEEVRRLGVVAQQVAAGDLSGSTGIRRADEVGEAARAIDHMVARLGQAETSRSRLEAERKVLLTSIGHDLRTPLAALRAAVESLQDGVAPDPGRYLAAMGNHLGAVESLIDELFLYARIEAGQLQLEPVELDLAELVDEAVEAMLPVAHRRGMRLSYVASGRVVARGGPAELGRVLRNLLDNALRYGPRGSVVHVELTEGEHMACVRVRDEGPGFPADFRARAFDAFSRADPARDRSTGTAGLGLAIARGIVDAHDGIIQIGDPPGGCVEVHLPLAGRPATRSIA